jgi:hypothetical protein
VPSVAAERPSVGSRADHPPALFDTAPIAVSISTRSRVAKPTQRRHSSVPGIGKPRSETAAAVPLGAPRRADHPGALIRRYYFHL